MSLVEARRKAQTAAAVYLEMRGYTIIEQNFRRPRATIDIVAEKDRNMYFVEVAYLRNGDELSATGSLSAAKLRSRHHAAEVWTQEYKWLAAYHLSTIEITGKDFVVMSFTDDAF